MVTKCSDELEKCKSPFLIKHERNALHVLHVLPTDCYKGSLSLTVNFNAEFAFEIMVEFEI